MGLIVLLMVYRVSGLLEGLYISSTTDLHPDVLLNGQVQSAYQQPGIQSKEIDYSSVLEFFMWVGPNWHNQTLYIVVQAKSMTLVPLYSQQLPTLSHSKSISDSITFTE